MSRAKQQQPAVASRQGVANAVAFLDSVANNRRIDAETRAAASYHASNVRDYLMFGDDSLEEEV